MSSNATRGYLTVRRAGKAAIKLYLEYREGGEKKQKFVPKHLWHNYGLPLTGTYEEVKAKVSQINSERHDLRKEINAAKRFETTSKVVRFFPEAMAKSFWDEFIGDNRGSDAHKQKLHTQFMTIQRLIIGLQLYPEGYKAKERRFVTTFIENRYSLNYSKNLVKMINLWGDWYCKQFTKRYEPIRIGSAFDKAAISRAQAKKVGKDSFRGVRIESDPLTWANLLQHKGKLSEGEFNYMALSVWFGLRPHEIDCLIDLASWRVEEVKGLQVLWVYQSKLITVDEKKKWKCIPCIMPEQTELIPLIEAGLISKPSYKKVRVTFGGKISLYGGRKNFISMMRDLGQDYIDISAWLGHQSTETTYKHYTDKQEVRWSPVSKKGA